MPTAQPSTPWRELTSARGGFENDDPRERFNAVIHFRKPDELPWCELLEDETVMCWVTEGLPIDALLTYEWAFKEGGPLTSFPALKVRRLPLFRVSKPFRRMQRAD